MAANSVVTSEYQTFVYYKRRYLLALLVGLNSATNSFQQLEFATISNVICDYYDVSEQLVNCNALLFNVGCIFFAYPIMKCIEKFGFAHSIVIDAALNAFGAAIKVCAIKRSMFYLLLIGQIFPAFGFLFSFSLPPILAANWFKSEHVAGIIAFKMALCSLAIALAFSMPSLIFNNLKSKHEIGAALGSISYTVAGIAITVFAMTVVFVKEKPKSPPSFAEHARIRGNTSESISNLWRNRNFLLLIIIFSLVAAVSQAVTIVLSQLVHKQFAKSIANRIVTRAGLLAILSEIPSTAIISMICARCKRYKTLLIAYLLLLAVFLIFCTIGFYISSEIAIYVFISLSKFTYIAIEVIVSDFIIEVTYPISEGVTLNIAKFFTALLGVLVVPLMTAVIKRFGSASASTVLVVIAALQFIFSFGVSNDLKRHSVNLRGSASENKIRNDLEESPLIR
ncbi:feline leukemia virus subgroup C receptor-related protein 2-like protein [Dinothrombium tinctorium]|uniref:Feline leukemia virus subgroup C receptor-related protein 2-like protein n=1 Tax=Dinothrombium tinctorium TaxID=1965070 RepID=A0A443QCS8_9ACAR|nr:feline leukemia virus subgroup C receptor-related protein 2-like protein [Dinothrombium tinctorium]